MSQDISSGSVNPRRQLEDMREFMKSLRQDFEAERQEFNDQLDELSEENYRLRQQIDELETELAEVRESTNLLRMLKKQNQPRAEQAKAALILDLKRKAERRVDRHDKRPVASLDRDAADDVLHHPDVHRTTINKWMKRAAESVDSDVLQYESGKLKINLQVGELPNQVVTNVTEGSL